MKKRVHNFSAGPATLPVEILEAIESELYDYEGIGSSIIEISHRDIVFKEVAKKAEISVRKLLSIPEDYDVIFMQGGATLQFSLIPLNFAHLGKTGNFADVGSWSAKAIKEASNICNVNICTSSKENNYTNIHLMSDWNVVENSSLVHYCKNETIQGIRITEEPKFSSYSFVDMSSCLFSENIDISKYDFIYACAQKNFGPSGITLVIAKKELLEKSNTDLPNILKYDAHANEGSMLNTPNTFGWYVAGKMFDWYLENGGVAEMEKQSMAKTAILYELIDKSDFYINPVNPKQRSINNVVFTIVNSELEKVFLQEAEKADFKYLKGHRSVGGMRASIYNPMKIESVFALKEFMENFEKNYG
ncbi:MAG: 3-phosphoserine/phosphohydroxythreonine transaminase [Gammaproteobacteria bacterium TMED112]|nr:MAG: 3-phosphoserine/phosphohydroxythreonine transaminase [Gammaproteobacteria bacterium TMED112]|tara:strand:+ start:7421 stop:8503 length:1083 start_codon:yes stop_codon:yes gene_type:complete